MPSPLHCSCIPRRKLLYAALEGTRRAHVLAAPGLGFRAPECGPKPVRFFNRPPECRSHLPRLQREIAVRELRPTASGLAFRSPGCGPKPVRFFLPQHAGTLSGHELGSQSRRSLSRLLPGSSDGVRE